jgi:nucleotide-binding universal stress UspA family protein
MRVLYPTDGRLPAIAAARLLTAIGDPATIEVTVLHVDEYGNKVVADRVAEEVLGEAVKHLADAGFAAAVKRAGGGVKHAIEHELVAGEHELVAMGTGNTGRLGGFVLGGVSTFVLHRSSVSTLVAHRPPNEGQDGVRVVVGTDGSAAARRGIDTLIAFARPDRCDFFVRSVVELQLSPPVGLAETAIPPTDALGRTMDDATEDANRFVREALERFSDAGFRCDGDVVRGSAEVALFDAVHDRDADLVVVGTRGRGRFAAMTLGSVSAHLVRAAPATLVAPAPGTDNDDG